MTRDVLPVIHRDYSEEDTDIEVLLKPYDSVQFVRGLGDSGYRLEVVRKQCPYCESRTNRLFREHRVFPDERDIASYYCLHPACPYFVRDQFNYIRGLPPREIFDHEPHQ